MGRARYAGSTRVASDPPEPPPRAASLARPGGGGDGGLPALGGAPTVRPALALPRAAHAAEALPLRPAGDVRPRRLPVRASGGARRVAALDGAGDRRARRE